MILAELCVPVAIGKYAFWLGATFLFFFANVETYRSSSGAIIVLRSPAFFFIAFLILAAFWIARSHFLMLPLPCTQWWHFDIVPAVQLLVHDRRNTQMMSSKHFALNYCNTTLNFTKVSSTVYYVILVKHLTARNSKWIKNLCSLPFYTDFALPCPMHLILLLFCTAYVVDATLHKSLVPY